MISRSEINKPAAVSHLHVLACGLAFDKSYKTVIARKQACDDPPPPQS